MKLFRRFEYIKVFVVRGRFYWRTLWRRRRGRKLLQIAATATSRRRGAAAWIHVTINQHIDRNIDQHIDQ